MKLEGIISKRLERPTRPAAADDWTKAKCRAGHEVVIGGWTRQAGQFRSLLVGVYRGEHLVHVGPRRHRLRCATMSQRAAANGSSRWQADNSPFGGTDAPRRGADITG